VPEEGETVHEGAGRRLVAGAVELDEVISHLVASRPVFHSEADLQFAFARAMFETAPQVRVRLEVPQRAAPGRRKYLDMLCSSPDGTATAVEFKYFTRSWAGRIGDEQYDLRAHAATDLARLYFLRDVARLEQMCHLRGGDGLALMLTNEPSLWDAPRARVRPSNDTAFRIHGGQTLAGELEWGNRFLENRTELRGSYTAEWQDYSTPDSGHSGGRFRWLGLWVGRGPDDRPPPDPW
jgi:hypothetical protein